MSLGRESLVQTGSAVQPHPRLLCRRILLIKLSSAGDIVHALPVLAGLRWRWPKAHIAWLVSTSFAELLEGHPDLDEVISFDRQRFGRLGRRWSATRRFAEFCWRLWARRFDLVVDLQGLFRSGFLSLVSGAPVRIGLAEAREFAGTFYTRRLASRPPHQHAVDRYYRAAGPLGFAHRPIRFPLAIKEADRAEAAGLLRQAGLEGRRFAALAVGARWETKRWPAERFAELADALADRYALASVLTGSAADYAVGEEVCRLSTSGPLNLAGRTRWRHLLGLLEMASLVVTNDSGPMHLAAALGRPLVAVLGPTNPTRTGPYGRPQAVLRRNLPCSPCYLRTLQSCPYAHTCLRDLPAEEVLAAVDRALSGQR